MSGNVNLPINFTFNSITGQQTYTHEYNVIPLSVTISMFTSVIIGYKNIGTTKTVIASKIINANEKEILLFVNANSGIDGYFVVYESDGSKQNQIIAQLPNGFQLGFK